LKNQLTTEKAEKLQIERELRKANDKIASEFKRTTTLKQKITNVLLTFLI